MFGRCYLHGWWEAAMWCTQPHKLRQKRPGLLLGSPSPRISLTWKCRPGPLGTAILKALPIRRFKTHSLVIAFSGGMGSGTQDLVGTRSLSYTPSPTACFLFMHTCESSSYINRPGCGSTCL